MSWFGETFGDSINNLKGQISKITKEVLADDETGAEGVDKNDQCKELEALCESKDLEIASLREEFDKLHKQYEKQIEFLKCRSTNDTAHHDDLKPEEINKLKNELIEVRKERDYLNSCLDDLQLEHQTNLTEVIKMRDKYKMELDEVKKEFNSLQIKCEEFNRSSDCDSDVVNLKNNIEKLQLSLEATKTEKAEALKRVEELENLKLTIEKLQRDIKMLQKEKEKIEEDNKILKNENEHLKKKWDTENIEYQKTELNLLRNENAELKKNSNQEILKFKSHFEEIKKKLIPVLQVLNIEVNKEISESDIVRLLGEIEIKLKKLIDNLNEAYKKEEVNVTKIKSLEDENIKLNNDLKTSIDKWTDTEKNYKEEISSMNVEITDMKRQRQDCINESQTDDVKRLEQEIAQLMNLLLTRNNEIQDYSRVVSNLEQEVKSLKSDLSNDEEKLLEISKEKNTLLGEIEQFRKNSASFNEQLLEMKESLMEVEQKNLIYEKKNAELQSSSEELKKQIAELTAERKKNTELQNELEKIQGSKTEYENAFIELQKTNSALKDELENVKAQLIIKESNLSELMKSNVSFQEEINQFQLKNNELQNAQKEIKKWKDACIDLEIQRQDLTSKKEELELECIRLKQEADLSVVKDQEISQLKQTNVNLVESCNRLHFELESKAELETQDLTKTNELEIKFREQLELISELKDENKELKSRIQKFQEQMKLQMVPQTQLTVKEDAQQHRRCKSVAEESPAIKTIGIIGTATDQEVMMLKQAVQQEQAKNHLLQSQLQDVLDKEANARKEFERLKQHLLEIEEHYTQEVVESEQTINDLKAKLAATEEQLQNSSTLYTSLKVRDNQHLESLQNQIRLMSTQRDEFQAKLSSAEDEVQKHKASLMSLQIVLEQFQQDKEREVEAVAMKYEKQLQLSHQHFKDLELEIEGLKKQLSDAKNGLKAASRLGEQLEKKTQHAVELEKIVDSMKEKIVELESRLAAANQSYTEKVDKLLIKNLIVGYILSTNADRKLQVLKIMSSVLDFDDDEKNKMGVNSTNSGWLSNILHPKSGEKPSNQSLSEAFIKFLENESRPQPHVKFHPEQFNAKPTTSTSAASSSKSSGRISELMLPTFNSPQEDESSIILKNVLKDS